MENRLQNEFIKSMIEIEAFVQILNDYDAEILLSKEGATEYNDMVGRYLNYKNNGFTDIYNMIIISNGGRCTLIDEIQGNLDNTMHIKGYISTLISRLKEPIYTSRMELNNDKSYTNEIQRDLAHYLNVFLQKLYDLCINYSIDITEFVKPPRCNPSNSQQPPHFNGDYTDEELTVTFEKLKQGSYIHSESDLDSWIYLCTGRAGKTFTAPINWLKSGVLLGMFVQDLFNDTDNTNIWELTAKCFTIQGKKPNTNSIKVSLSKIKQNWKDRPKDYDKMQNEIIKDIT